MDNNSYKAVTIQNIDSEDFVFEYNRSGGNPPYLIKSGEIVTYPYFLADHAVNHLIDKILNKRELSTNSPGEREKLAAQIVIKEEDYHRISQLTPAEQLKNEIEDMNKSNDLQFILDKRKAEADIAAQHTPPVSSGPSNLPEVDTTEHFEGLTPKPEEPVVPETSPLAPLPTTPVLPTVVAKPTRKELYAYAKDVVKMEMNKKTLDKLDSLVVDELITELDYPLGETNA